ncbi:Zn-dependent hydrolase [Paracoccus suum]|uniref:Zn-dependent hydrolase n=1 Tax=Paracoccus suum TaxID=2259340 RepID=A0A344PLH4_9RHOB|nr:Zn-dependent hydrolase [Paracoccus suum]AXC50229.1 Zn-dependent hydrolase [Paracoccus suum]
MTAAEGSPAPLRVNGGRLWKRHMDIARIGAIAGDGCCRLAMTPEDAEARRLLAEWGRAANMEMRVDRAGNMIFLRPGADPARLPVASGSHLDTQPHGGRFDGISGVLAALEVVETLNDAGIETVAPLAVVNWTNEEGVRFAPGLTGSGWYAGFLDDGALDNAPTLEGSCFAEEAERLGWRGADGPAAVRFDSFFELHIEQGPILEQAGRRIGVVESIQGLVWLDVEVRGRDGHAGTTPMDSRSDALLASARMLVALSEIGRAQPDARVSVGQFLPGTDGPSTIMGDVRFVIDVRHPDPATLSLLARRCSEACVVEARTAGCEATVEQRVEISPTRLDANCVSAVENAAALLGESAMRMASGALHDTCNIAEGTPAAMIFVPCRDGISHNVAEYASPEDLAAGASVLLHAMLARAGTA